MKRTPKYRNRLNLPFLGSSNPLQNRCKMFWSLFIYVIRSQFMINNRYFYIWGGIFHLMNIHSTHYSQYLWLFLGCGGIRPPPQKKTSPPMLPTRVLFPSLKASVFEWDNGKRFLGCVKKYMQPFSHCLLLLLEVQINYFPCAYYGHLKLVAIAAAAKCELHSSKLFSGDLRIFVVSGTARESDLPMA